MCDQSSRVRDVFDDWARLGRAEGMAQRHLPVVIRALDHITLQPDGWFLDIGCGSGYVVTWAADALPDGRAFGVDLSSEMIALCRQTARPNVTFVQGAFPDVELPKDRFDAVFSMEAFYYLPDLDGAIAAVLRLLRPGGVFVCVVDYFEENEDSHSWPDDLGVRMDLRSERQWVEAFQRAGFEDVCQQRVRVPTEESEEAGHTSAGSLLTRGRRPIPG